MRRHDLAPTLTYLPTNALQCTSIREHPKGAILETCDLWDIWSEWWGDMTWPKNLPTHLPTNLREHPKGAILETCELGDNWDTDYNTDNWEPGLMTIFVIWQLIVTLDSIRNSCDVFWKHVKTIHWCWDITATGLLWGEVTPCWPETRHFREYWFSPRSAEFGPILSQISC